MTFWSRISSSLALRLTLLLGLLLAAYGALTAYLSASTLSRNLLDETRLGVVRLVDTVKRSTHDDMMNYRPEDVREIIKSIGRQDGIDHVRIFNKNGMIMYSATASEIKTTVDLDAEACSECHRTGQPPTRLENDQRSRIYSGQGGSRVLAATGVIYNEPDCWTAECHEHLESQEVLGVVDIGVSLSETDRRVSASESWALYFGLSSTLLVCVLVGLFVYQFVNRPVRKLIDGVQRVAEGDLEASIPVKSTDEIGRLGRSFNKMTHDLGTARAELRQWAETLEKQVEEKTRDLKIAQAQVVRSEKLSSLGILAAGVAHELNSPLTGILTFAHLLLQKVPEDSQEREDLLLIVNESNRCATIIRQLLDFSRENAPERKPVDVNEIIRRVVSLVRHQAKFHDIRIECDLEDSLPPVKIDPGQMEQVFLNLLVNSAEATTGEGMITICSRVSAASAERLEVEFTDTGAGIAPEVIDKIFDPFFTSKAVGQGTGLGLAVSYGIIKRNGGSIEVKSTLGKGSMFLIRMPAATPEVASS